MSEPDPELDALDLRAAQFLGEWDLDSWAPTRNLDQALRFLAETRALMKRGKRDFEVSDLDDPLAIVRECLMAIGDATDWSRT